MSQTNENYERTSNKVFVGTGLPDSPTENLPSLGKFSATQTSHDRERFWNIEFKNRFGPSGTPAPTGAEVFERHARVGVPYERFVGSAFTAVGRAPARGTPHP